VSCGQISVSFPLSDIALIAVSVPVAKISEDRRGHTQAEEDPDEDVEGGHVAEGGRLYASRSQSMARRLRCPQVSCRELEGSFATLRFNARPARRDHLSPKRQSLLLPEDQNELPLF
jgi:hypothetical protein